MQVRISVTSDFICPWCYIGEKRLARALERLPSGIDVQLQWLPFELNPDMPAEGMERSTYLTRKFGSWERVQAMQSQIVLAGRGDGAVLTMSRSGALRIPSSHIAFLGSRNAQTSSGLSSRQSCRHISPRGATSGPTMF